MLPEAQPRTKTNVEPMPQELALVTTALLRSLMTLQVNGLGAEADEIMAWLHQRGMKISVQRVTNASNN